MNPLIAKLNVLLTLWHENGRPHFERTCPNLNYNRYYPKTMKIKQRWIYLDRADSGVFMVDPGTEMVYRVKAYGVPNLRKPVGTVDWLIEEYRSTMVKPYEYV